MLRSLILLVLVALTAPVRAGECEAREPEDFATFFSQFADDKQFATSRTIYPVRSIKWEFGADEKGNDASVAVRSKISKEQNAKAPTLASHMKENGLTARTKNISKRVLAVEVFKPSTDWIVIFKFMRKGNCWFFTEYEDQSL